MRYLPTARSGLAFAALCVGSLAFGLAPANAYERADVEGRVLAADGAPLGGLHVMMLEGRRRVPTFVVRPQAFGLPLPNVRVARTADDGTFRFERVKLGTKTLLIGEEGLLLFGTAAERLVDTTGEPLAIRLTEAEQTALGSLPDRAERATEVMEEVLVELDLALGWYVQTRSDVEDSVQEARERVEATLDQARARFDAARRRLFGDDQNQQGELPAASDDAADADAEGESAPAPATATAAGSAWERLRARAGELWR